MGRHVSPVRVARARASPRGARLYLRSAVSILVGVGRHLASAAWNGFARRRSITRTAVLVSTSSARLPGAAATPCRRRQHLRLVGIGADGVKTDITNVWSML